MHGLFHEGKIYGCEECTHEAKDEYQFVWRKQMHNGKPKFNMYNAILKEKQKVHIKAKSSKFSENQMCFQISMQNHIVCL